MNKLLCILLILSIWACQPEDLILEDQEVEFHTQFEIESQTKSFTAGMDQFFLEPGHYLNENVLHYKGTFKKEENCQNSCSESIEFIIRDFKNFESSNFDVTNSISEGSYDYLGRQHVEASKKFIEVVNTSLSSSNVVPKWDFGVLPFENVFQDVIRLEVSENISAINGSLSIQNQEGCASSISKSIMNDNLEILCGASFKIIETEGPVPEKIITIEASGTPPFAFEWNNGIAQPFFTVSSEFEGSVSARVTDATGCISDINLNLGLTPLQDCYADFQYSVVKRAEVFQTFSLVSIVYTSPEGKIYSSDLANQDDQGQFEISNLEEYQIDEMGNPTKKFDLNFTAKLGAEDESSISITNGNAQLAVSYPSK